MDPGSPGAVVFPGPGRALFPRSLLLKTCHFWQGPGHTCCFQCFRYARREPGTTTSLDLLVSFRDCSVQN